MRTQVTQKQKKTQNHLSPPFHANYIYSVELSEKGKYNFTKENFRQLRFFLTAFAIHFCGGTENETISHPHTALYFPSNKSLPEGKTREKFEDGVKCCRLESSKIKR